MYYEFSVVNVCRSNNIDLSRIADRQLHCVTEDLFVDGTVTVSTSLRWALLYTAAYPHVQQRVYDELSAAIGMDRQPNMNDKRRTPYTEAVLAEVQRFISFLPLSAGQTNRYEDFQLGEFVIPKNVPVLANLYAVHRDPKLWKNPHEFDPSNFLATLEKSSTWTT